MSVFSSAVSDGIAQQEQSRYSVGVIKNETCYLWINVRGKKHVCKLLCEECLHALTLVCVPTGKCHNFLQVIR